MGNTVSASRLGFGNHINPKLTSLDSKSVQRRNCASKLFRDVFGAAKNPVRPVFGVASLPLNAPVELEVIFELPNELRIRLRASARAREFPIRSGMP